MAKKNIFKGTDFLEMIKLNRDFKVLKYLLLNNVQQKTFDFVSNLKLGEHNWYDMENYSEIINSKDINETIKIMKEYYAIELRRNKKYKIDNKLYSLIHPKIKEIIEEADA